MPHRDKHTLSRHSCAGGNQVPHRDTHPRHSRAGGNPVPRRDKHALSRHSRADGNQVPHRDKHTLSRHSCAGGNPVPPQGQTRSLSSFPRRRESSAPQGKTHTLRHSREGGNPPPVSGPTHHPLVIAHAARCMLAMTRVFNKQRLSEFFLLLFFFKCSKF